MKTTVEIPDDLYRRAKAEAALRGRKLRDLVEEGLRLALEARPKTRRPSLAGLTKRARGIIDSGVPDLASNPKHLAGFGHDDRRHRRRPARRPRVAGVPEMIGLSHARLARRPCLGK